MRRSPVPILVCLLTLLSAGALLRAEVVLTQPPPAVAHFRPDEHKDVVRRFYTAVNTALTTGDLAPLRKVVAPDFVAHAPRPGLPPNRDGLERELIALRAAAPGFRLTPTSLLADGDLVVAQVQETGAPAAFLGLPLPTRTALWGAVDRFRVTNGRIAEHWGEPERAWLEPLARVPMHLYPPAWRTAKLTRRTYAPGARNDPPSEGPRLLILEHGGLVVQTGATAAAAAPGSRVLRWAASASVVAGAEARPTIVPPGQEATLTPGQVVVVGQGVRVTVRNLGRTEATTLEVTLEPPGTADGFGATYPDANAPSEGGTAEVADTALAGGVAVPLPTGEAALAVGRIVLAPGTGLPAHPTVGPELIVVEAGTLEATTSSGAWSGPDPAQPRALAAAATLAPGAGLLVEAGTVAAYRNAGDAPLVLLVATLVPADPATGTPTP